MSQEKKLAELRQEHDDLLTKRLTEAFVNHAIDNRGLLTSTRRATAVVEQLKQLVWDYVSQSIGDADVIVAVTELASQGLSMKSGTALMGAISSVPLMQTADSQLQQAATQKVLDFQLLFLENLSSARILIQQRTQERSQKALQDALHAQIEQQRLLRHEQETYNVGATKILALNAHLADITDESQLLDQAVSGICQALDLANVTIYDLSTLENHWSVRTTTDASIRPYDIIPNTTLQFLNQALVEDELLQYIELPDDKQQLLAVLMIRRGENLLGASLFNTKPLPHHQIANLPILLRTYAQNLASHWHNIQLFSETKQRSLEMEILYGRYIDSIWNPETAALQASYEYNNFQISRQNIEPQQSDKTHSVPIVISDHPIGHISFPQDISLDAEQEIFVQDIIREMGNALNNAFLLQTTRATSNQLSLATEVSRAATTILDKEMLGKEVVELIRARFGFYYVGLFLLDEQGGTAVLQAGTGEAGRLQLEREHHQLIGGPSMIGTCIASGEAIVEQDVTQAVAFKFNPLLPDTRSELAMPLRTRGQIIGAITVQSTQKGAFTGEAIAVLQSLADQLAIAIENASLFAQIEDTLAETHLLYQASRQMSEAQTPNDVYDALVNFARASDHMDSAYIAIARASDPAYFDLPAGWSRHRTTIKNLPKRSVEFSKQLKQNETIIVADTHVDTRLDTATENS